MFAKEECQNPEGYVTINKRTTIQIHNMLLIIYVSCAAMYPYCIVT